MKSIYDLLMTAPEEQITKMRRAWRAVVDGNWLEAESKLRNVAAETIGQFSADCLAIAEICRSNAQDA
ncbi:hypothetical protein P3T24_007875 [Paraburkholderia sp. GAS33]|uniref:hypothetical protein n=1 Tax=Paraburkholderia sp. GAS33 TaxID=3035130 RepID=UPI003D205993